MIRIRFACAVEVEDLIEAEPAPVEEELRTDPVGDDAVTVLGHGLQLLQSADNKVDQHHLVLQTCRSCPVWWWETLTESS